MLHVVWTLPDPSHATTEAFQLTDVSAWSPLISVKCSILNQMPICDPAGSGVTNLECGWEEHKWGMYSSFRQTDSDALARLSC